MSHIIYNQNKLICYFTLSSELQKNLDPSFRINQLVLIVHHFQYPCVHYQKIFKHFKNLLPKNIKKQHIRIKKDQFELPSDLPIGLFIEQPQIHLTVTISNFQIPQPYKIIKQNWKRAFSAINSNKGCDYIYKRLSQPQLRSKIQKYFNGQGHGLQNQSFQGYQGNNIMMRFFIEGQIIERKAQALEQKNVKQLIEDQIPQLCQRHFIVKSHGVRLDLNMSIKQFLDEWSYNDGFNYLKIQLQNQKQ